MAPIDPNQLLAAFAPLLTSSGGIKNATEVPRLSSLMKKFSRKLVSRCVYCNVLLATNTDVLEEFLKSGGWETIHLWIKSAKDLGNKPFLEELLKLLLILPMNVDRLRENDSPKIINKLCKSDDLELALKAKQIVDKWTKMIELASGGKVGKDKEHSNKDHKKKRKKDSIESNNVDNKDNTVLSDQKKIKLIAKPLELNSMDFCQTIAFDLNKEESKPKVERTVRPSTAKVKPGKSRLDGLVSSTINPKPPKVIRKEFPNIRKLSPNSGNNTEPQSAVTSTLAALHIKTEVKPIVITTISPPTALVSPTPPVVTQPAIKHVLHDSTSFMDALIAPPTQDKPKKKRRSSATHSSKDSPGANSADNTSPTTTSPPRASPPKFSFYTDMIDEKVGQKVNESNNNSNNNDIEDNDVIEISDSNTNGGPVVDQQLDESMSSVNEEEMNHMNIDITVPEISVDPSINLKSPLVICDRSSSNKVKPILCYIKKGTKKSVRWVDDNRLQTVRYFELDETERVNVTRPQGSGGFADIKRFDMKHEAEFMLSYRGRPPNNTFEISDDYMNRVESFSAWKLIPCDGDTNFVEIGKDSKERQIQADRMRTTLETLYLKNQLPDSPQEPESELHIEAEPTKTIPLEDDNNPNNCHDFSNIDLPQPKTGEQLPPRVADFKTGGQPRLNEFNTPPMHPTPMPFMSGPPQPLLPGANNFTTGQPIIPPFGGQPLLPSPGDPFSMRPPHPPQPFYPPNNGPPPFQQWSDSGPPRPGPPPPHFVPQFPNHGNGMGPVGPRPPRLPRNAQNTVCKHFARTGKCRFQPKCHFLHTNDR